MRDVAGANATLAQAEARHRQALSQIDAARAGARPGATASVGATRSGGSQTATSRLYEASLDIRWAPDLWGRVGQATAPPRPRPRPPTPTWPPCAWPCN